MIFGVTFTQILLTLIGVLVAGIAVAGVFALRKRREEKTLNPIVPSQQINDLPRQQDNVPEWYGKRLNVGKSVEAKETAIVPIIPGLPELNNSKEFTLLENNGTNEPTSEDFERLLKWKFYRKLAESDVDFEPITDKRQVVGQSIKIGETMWAYTLKPRHKTENVVSEQEQELKQLISEPEKNQKTKPVKVEEKA